MRAEHARLERRSSLIGRVRIACVLVVVGVLATLPFDVLPRGVAWAGAVAAIAFILLVVVHGRVDRERDRREAAMLFHEQALNRAPPLPRVDDPELANHPYASDLDMTGPHSVYAFISFCRSQPGRRTLREWLLAAHDPPALGVIRARQDAARTLSKKPELVRSLWVAGIDGGPEKAVAFERWALAKEAGVVGSGLRAFAWVWPPVTIASLVMGQLLGWSSLATWGAFGVAIVVSLLMRGRLGPVVAAVVANEGGALVLAEAFDAALAEREEGELLAKVQFDLASGRTALRALRAPTLALESLQNEVFRLLIAPLFMVELHAVAALERWRKEHGARAADWFAAYGTMESVASLGLLAHDFPAFAWPELAAEPCFDARALGHPLVADAKRVCNDVGPLDAGSALVITGSNMSGKSTLLRSIGVATAMAAAGGPVCAEKLVIGPVRLGTSMRVADSLAEGASRFYAELRRLKLVVDMASRGPGVLFLLDEVLYGTNARERLIGSRATLAWLLEHAALGAVSTHDLDLADLSGPLAARARNVHFEEQVVGDIMTFDYKLRDGVVQSSNALRLMKELGLPVAEEG